MAKIEVGVGIAKIGVAGLFLVLEACGFGGVKPGLVANSSMSVDGGVVAQACGAGSPGHLALRRLTNSEYTNSVQDLLFTKQTPGASMEQTLPGPSGFSNDPTALTISSQLLLGYYTAAESLADEWIASKGVAGGAYAKIVTCQSSDPNCAKTVVSAFAKRAFRRPPTAAELDPNSGLMSVFNSSGSFDQGLHDVIVSVLINPYFLMIPIVNAQSANPNAVFALDNYQTASRLSYALWQTMPDAGLMAAADNGTLMQPEVLKAQVKRMLADPRALRIKDALRDEYAGLSSLAKTDFSVVGQTNSLRDSMIGETDAFFADLISKDRSPLTVLNGRQSFVNAQLATFYGLTFPAGADPASFVAVPSSRIGLAAQASVLTNTSGGDPTFTNPIKRGHWLIQQIYCQSPPPPPPGVPPLPAASGSAQTIRQRIAQHVSNPVCASCHTDIDNFGFGAEDFGPFGQFRTTYSDHSTVDSSGALPSGVTFKDSMDMLTKLSGENQALSCFPQQIMSYALTRPISGDSDSCAAKTIGSLNMQPGSTFSDMVVSIVTSRQFLMQTGEAQ